jgi:hypothetical protein
MTRLKGFVLVLRFVKMGSEFVFLTNNQRGIIKMIRSDEKAVLEYDVESQIEAMELIKAALSSCHDVGKLQYFVRENCRPDDIPAGLFDDLKARHSNLCNEIEAFEV